MDYAKLASPVAQNVQLSKISSQLERANDLNSEAIDEHPAVIIAARGVTLSSNFLSGLLETDAIVLHCDERYQP